MRRPHNFAKSPPYFWLALHRTKVSWNFAKFCGLLRIYELYIHICSTYEICCSKVCWIFSVEHMYSLFSFTFEAYLPWYAFKVDCIWKICSSFRVSSKKCQSGLNKVFLFVCFRKTIHKMKSQAWNTISARLIMQCTT